MEWGGMEWNGMECVPVFSWLREEKSIRCSATIHAIVSAVLFCGGVGCGRAGGRQALILLCRCFRGKMLPRLAHALELKVRCMNKRATIFCTMFASRYVTCRFVVGANLVLVMLRLCLLPRLEPRYL